MSITENKYVKMWCAEAICIGTEVWTVDWHGVVTVRDRDNASKVLGTIPTDRFVWSMLQMKPGLMWMGQEAFGISLFDSKKWLGS